MTALLVALGAALGAPVRYLAAHVLDRAMPWGTLAVNLVGSFLLGLVAGLSLDDGPFALLGTGFCGGLTTYSSFAVQAEQRGVERGGVVIIATVLPALALCWVGFQLTA